MAIPLEKVINDLPPERQKRIQKKATAYIKEYKTLQELRKGLNLTQTDIADTLRVKQVSISNLEKRADMLLSTLHNYVEAMGCELEIFIKTPDQNHVKIIDLLPRNRQQ
jgi:transcriptional regulator with XRE-family HTH domain